LLQRTKGIIAVVRGEKIVCHFEGDFGFGLVTA
jgi:hypothetical protein